MKSQSEIPETLLSTTDHPEATSKRMTSRYSPLTRERDSEDRARRRQLRGSIKDLQMHGVDPSQIRRPHEPARAEKMRPPRERQGIPPFLPSAGYARAFAD